MAKIKAAIVGFGMSGAIFHAPFLHASDKFELSAIVQRSGNTCQQQYPDCRVFRSFEELLDDGSVELVVIGTPNYLHYQMAKEALLAGKHVVVEKPFATRSAECLDLINVADQKDRKLFVYHNRRWDGDFMTVQQVVEARKLGGIVSYEAHYDRYSPGLNKKAWKERTDPGVSILHDLGTHLIDQAVCLFGIPVAVTGHLLKEREFSAVSDGFEVRLEFSDFYAVLKSSLLVAEPGPRYIVHGRFGSFIKYGIDPQEKLLQTGLQPTRTGWGEDTEKNWGLLHTVVDGLHRKQRVRTRAGNYMNFYDNVAEVVLDGAAMAVSPEEALVTVRVIEATEESHRLKKTVKFLQPG